MSPLAIGRTTWLFEQFCGNSLKQPVSDRYDGLSQINANGLPFQWLCRIGDDRFPVAFVCESGEPGTSCLYRYQYSWQLLEHVFSNDPGEALPIIRQLAETHVLPAKDNWPSHWRSAMWFGVVSGESGFATKVYFNLNEGAATHRWRKIGKVLLHLNRKNGLQQLCDLSNRVSTHSWPVGIAFDLIPGKSVGRVKVYFRSDRVTRAWLARWYESVDCSKDAFAISSLLDAFPLLNRTYYPEQSMHVSLEFPADDSKVTLKSDLNFCRFLELDDASAQSCIEQLADRLELDASGYRSDLGALLSAHHLPYQTYLHRFIGVGLETDGSRHMNIYIEPETKLHHGSPRRILEPQRTNVVRRAVDFLHTKLEGDHWTDFNLPVGPSDEWVTAYTLSAIDGLLSSSHQPQVSWVHDVVRWLQQRQHAQGGWGYHAFTPSDADSTTLALKALSRWTEHPPDPAWLRFLIQFQNKNGGFATYLLDDEDSDAWCQAAADVTGLAGAVLKPVSPSSWEKAVRFLQKHQKENGMWDSYWWLSPLYATWVALECLGQCETIPRRDELQHALERYSPSTDFEIALLVQCWIKMEMPSKCKLWIHALRRSQLDNGSWHSGAFLRLTHPHVFTPQETIDSGTVYSDHQRVFTTATVLGALLKYEASI